MPDQPISVFISYSRMDNAFVDRLEADLRARNFRTWVDRRKLEGGQIWLDELQKAIDQCQVLLVVLSPEAVVSDYVKMEYRYASHLGKLVIPLEYRHCPKVPIDLNSIQWVNFKSTYEQGLKNLLIALSPIETRTFTTQHPSPDQTTRDIAMRIKINEEDPDLVVPQPAPLPPNPDLNALYRAGVAVRANGDLERTATLWQQVLDRDPNFGNGILASQMKELKEELHPIRVKRLRELAEQAHRSGEWGPEIGAWQALLGIEPQDSQAQERISIAIHNQQYVWMYENAQQFVTERNLPSAKTQLQMLWQNAPYYGDPRGIAKGVSIHVPSSYDAVQASKRKAQMNKARMKTSIRWAFHMISFVVFIGAVVVVVGFMISPRLFKPLYDSIGGLIPIWFVIGAVGIAKSIASLLRK
jgi:hypothetical protein